MRLRPNTDRIAALVENDLYEQFGDRYIFHPVIAEPRIRYGSDETEVYYGVWVGYSGCSEPPDASILNGISARIREELMELGLTWVAANIIPAGDFKKARADSAYSPEELIKATQMTGPMTWKDATIPDLDRIASLVRHDLYDQFGDRYVFHPVIAERRIHYGYTETDVYYGVWVGYSGCAEPPDSKVRIGISVRIFKDLMEMGLTHVATDIIPADEFEETRRRVDYVS